MLAMVASLVILFIFGLCTSQFRWKSEYLFPHSASGFLSNLGLFVHSLAFILFLLSNTVRVDWRRNSQKHLKKQYKKHATRTIGVAVVAMASTSIAMMASASMAILSAAGIPLFW